MRNQSFKYIVIALVVATVGLAAVALFRPRGLERPDPWVAANRPLEVHDPNRSAGGELAAGSRSGQVGDRGLTVAGASQGAPGEEAVPRGDVNAPSGDSKSSDAPELTIGSGSPLPGGATPGGIHDKDGNLLPSQYQPDGGKADSGGMSEGSGSEWDPSGDDRSDGSEGDAGEEADPTPTETPSPEQATLGGRVVRGDVGVGDAQVQLTAEGFWKQVRSDSTGRYDFPPLEPGDYTLRLMFPPTPLPLRMISLAMGESRANEDFVIPDFPPMTGQVVNDDTGQGVPSPSVSVWQGQKGFGEVRGDGSGNFELFPLDPGSYTLRAIANGFRPGDTSFEVSATSGGNSPIQVRLTPAVTLSGRVVDENGMPLDGALVALFSPGSVYGGPYASQPFQTTQGGGQFLFSSLPADGGNVRAGAYRQGYVPAYSQTLDPANTDGKVGDILLARGTTVSGRVVNTEGEPIDFVLVDVTAGFSNSGGIYQRFNYQFPTAESSSLGVFSLPAIEPGSVKLRFTATDYITKEEQFTAAGPQTNVGDVEMESSDEPKEGRLAGLVITEEGKGLPSHNVYIRCLDCSPNHEALQNTDSQGRFSFENVPVGTYSIDVSGSTFRGNLWVPLSQRYVGARPGGESIVLLYDMSHSIKARLVDVSGTPVRRFQAGISVIDSSPSNVSGQNNEMRMRYETEMNTSEGVMTLPSLISGTANLTISVSGGGTEEISGISIPPNQPLIDLGEIVVSQGGSVKGYIVAEEGGGSVQGVTVEALPPEGSSGSHPLNSLSFSTLTGPTGEFELSGLPEATIDVQFRKPGRVATRRRSIPVVAGETANLGEVALPLAAIIEGRVTDAVTGSPISDVLINFNNWIAFSDREGKYRADMVPPEDIAMIAIHNVAGNAHEKFAAQFHAPAGEITVFDFEMIPRE